MEEVSSPGTAHARKSGLVREADSASHAVLAETAADAVDRILGGDARNLSRSIMDYPRESSAAVYMARFNGNPKTAQPGVDINDGSDYHYVIGFIPEAQP